MWEPNQTAKTNKHIFRSIFIDEAHWMRLCRMASTIYILDVAIILMSQWTFVVVFFSSFCLSQFLFVFFSFCHEPEEISTKFQYLIKYQTNLLTPVVAVHTFRTTQNDDCTFCVLARNHHNSVCDFNLYTF